RWIRRLQVQFPFADKSLGKNLNNMRTTPNIKTNFLKFYAQNNKCYAWNNGTKVTTQNVGCTKSVKRFERGDHQVLHTCIETPTGN
uniref:Uncharacterized protein n=1 Tax=Oryzias sinensis TaxID=183150 RepID=A0A8C7YZW0_9TELE